MTINRKLLNAVWTAVFFMLLCVGLSVFSGCEFYPEELNEKEAATFTVAFDADGGEPATQTLTVARGEPVESANMPDEPTKTVYTSAGSGTDGVNEAADEPTETVYTFGGWYTERDGGGELFTESTPVEADITVYAKWIRADSGFTVIFNADGGRPNKERKRTIENGKTVGALMPPAPTKDGHVFSGWYTDKEGEGELFTESTTVTANITVYAKWVTAITVSFDADGGTPATQTRTGAVGGTVSALPPAPTKAGHIFDGWYTKKDGEGSQFTESTYLNVDITVYAKWLYTVTVSFDADGGTPATQTRTGAVGGTLDALPSAPTKAGHIFDGWYTEKDGGGSLFTESTYVDVDITVYAKWGTAVTVSFDADGGEPATQTLTVASGGTVETANMPSEPAKTDYFFGGWYTERNGGGSEFNESTSVENHITVYAKWLPADSEFTVIFDAAGGTLNYPTRTVDYQNGRTVGSTNMPSDPTKTDYTFGGWYTGQDGGGSPFTGSTLVRADITVYAKWTLVPRTVTFNADGGSPATQLQTVEHGKTFGASMPSAPTKAGHTFDGWHTASGDAETEFTASTQVTADITVYAKWTLNSYTVTFNADGGDSETQTRTVNYESSVGSSNMPSDPTKTGYTFDGWYTGQTGGGSLFIASTPVTANITVYAKWTLNSYTVTFNADGGNPPTQPRTVKHSETLSDSMPSDPTKTGYTFDRWYTGQNGGGSLFTASTPVTANITVYAKWTLNSYTVTFNADGGSPEPQPQTVEHGKTLSASAIPSGLTRIGYIFDGWYTGQDGVGSQFTANTQVTANITVYANWTSRSYLVTFRKWDSSVLKSVTVGHGGTLPDMPDHTRDGYIFEGWYTESYGGGSKVTADTPIMANIDLYPKLTLIQVPSELGLRNALNWLSANAVTGGAYTITLNADETISPQTLSYDGKTVVVTIKSTAERTIRLDGPGAGALFTVGMFVRLILADAVILHGLGPNQRNSDSLVKVNSGGTFIMDSGSVRNNINMDSGAGGGVYVRSGGTFTMKGGTIQGNSVLAPSESGGRGGGVYVENGGTFNKSGGTIYGSGAADDLKNRAVISGDVAFVAGLPVKRRNSTAGPQVTLSDGSNDNWE
jgi:uncharacterized repeat protein (TIGR02543 family)